LPCSPVPRRLHLAGIALDGLATATETNMHLAVGPSTSSG
jgi:hypothetical protein